MKKHITILILLFIVLTGHSQIRFVYADSLSMGGANPTPKSYILANKIKRVTVEKYSKYNDKAVDFKLFQTYQYDTLGNIVKVIGHSGKYATTMDSIVYDAFSKTKTIYSGYFSPKSIKLKLITHYINDTLEESQFYKDAIITQNGKAIYNAKKQLVLSEFADTKTSQTTNYLYTYNENGLPSKVEEKDSTNNFRDIYLFDHEFYKRNRITTIYWSGRGKKEISCIVTYNKFNQCIKFQQWSVSKLSSTTKFEYNEDGSLYQATEKSENMYNSKRLEILRFYYLKN